jgi:transcriptional regulator of acetoin/glycerol metabolism
VIDDITQPPKSLQAFFGLRDWPSLSDGERRLVVEIASICEKAGAEDAFAGLTLEQVEGLALRRAWKDAGGSPTKMSKLLGIDRRTVYRKLRKLREGVDAGARAQGGAL